MRKFDFRSRNPIELKFEEIKKRGYYSLEESFAQLLFSIIQCHGWVLFAVYDRLRTQLDIEEDDFSLMQHVKFITHSIPPQEQEIIEQDAYRYLAGPFVLLNLIRNVDNSLFLYKVNDFIKEALDAPLYKSFDFNGLIIETLGWGMFIKRIYHINVDEFINAATNFGSYKRNVTYLTDSAEEFMDQFSSYIDDLLEEYVMKKN